MIFEDKKDQLDDVLLGAESIVKPKKKDLERARYKIQELEKMLERSFEMKKEAIHDFVAQICEIKDAFKKCKDNLSREILRKEAVE